MSLSYYAVVFFGLWQSSSSRSQACPRNSPLEPPLTVHRMMKGIRNRLTGVRWVCGSGRWRYCSRWCTRWSVPEQCSQLSDPASPGWADSCHATGLPVPPSFYTAAFTSQYTNVCSQLFNNEKNIDFTVNTNYKTTAVVHNHCSKFYRSFSSHYHRAFYLL